jgi:hypothetical protein
MLGESTQFITSQKYMKSYIGQVSFIGSIFKNIIRTLRNSEGALEFIMRIFSNFFACLPEYSLFMEYASLPYSTPQNALYVLCSETKGALHLEARPNPLQADCMKFQPFLGWRPASTTHYNKIIMGANFSICKGLRAKKLG